MGFLDKAKAAASDLAAKADTAMGNAGLSGGTSAGGGDADKYFRDLGVLAFLDASGRAGDPEEHRRVMTTLQEMNARGAIRSFALHTAAPPAPGMAGAGVQGGFPPPPGQAAPPPPPPPPSGEPAPQWQAPPAASAPPPPPPSWMTKDGEDNA